MPLTSNCVSGSHGRPPQPYDDWIDVADTHPMDRIRALINTAEKDYLSEARRNRAVEEAFLEIGSVPSEAR